MFIGCSASEAHDVWTADADKVTGYEMTGCTRSMFANRLSYFFDFKGTEYCYVVHCSGNQAVFKKKTKKLDNHYHLTLWFIWWDYPWLCIIILNIVFVIQEKRTVFGCVWCSAILFCSKVKALLTLDWKWICYKLHKTWWNCYLLYNLAVNCVVWFNYYTIELTVTD